MKLATLRDGSRDGALVLATLDEIELYGNDALLAAGGWSWR